MAVDHNYTLISRYSLLVSPAYGQYLAELGSKTTTRPTRHARLPGPGFASGFHQVNVGL